MPGSSASPRYTLPLYAPARITSTAVLRETFCLLVQLHTSILLFFAQTGCAYFTTLVLSQKIRCHLKLENLQLYSGQKNVRYQFC